MRIFWNYQPQDPINNAVGKGSLVQSRRSNRGSISLKLFDRMLNRPKLFEDTNRVNNRRNEIRQWELRNSEVENSISNDLSTLIWCKVFRIPTEIHVKHHIVKVCSLLHLVTCFFATTTRTRTRV